tara:strand:- start:1118 stop:2338 length:1221 start_codon:yes stop_codon:yes gene_type:complete
MKKMKSEEQKRREQLAADLLALDNQQCVDGIHKLDKNLQKDIAKDAKTVDDNIKKEDDKRLSTKKKGKGIIRTERGFYMIQPRSKIPMVISGGIPFSATTPLFYTLSWDHKYVHPGHKKELGYLVQLENQEFFGKEWWDGRSDPYKLITGQDETWKPPHLNKNSKYVQHFTEEQIRDYISAPGSIQKYITYYTTHHDNLQGEYTGVCDFSNDNGWLKPAFLEKYAPILKEHFDIKFLLIYRDPVRRTFSEFSSKFYRPETFGGKLVKQGFVSPGQPLEDKHATIEDFFYHEVEKSDSRWYVDFFIKFVKHFPTLPLVMEDLWDPDKFKEQTDRLSTFLGYPITKLHENVYWPERGPDAPRHDYLEDQWGSDREQCSDELLAHGRKVLDPVYRQWKNTFGSLPEAWL